MGMARSAAHGWSGSGSRRNSKDRRSTRSALAYRPQPSDLPDNRQNGCL